MQEDLFGKEKVKGVNLPKPHKTVHNERQLPLLDTLYAATESRPGMTLFPVYRKGFNVLEIIEDKPAYWGRDSHKDLLKLAETSLPDKK